MAEIICGYGNFRFRKIIIISALSAVISSIISYNYPVYSNSLLIALFSLSSVNGYRIDNTYQENFNPYHLCTSKTSDYDSVHYINDVFVITLLCFLILLINLCNP